jgi:L-iditol 2-dehydrogenase
MSQLKQMMPGGTILKVRTCSVCGYDVRVFHYGHKKVMTPVVLGHEICAETTESVGSVRAGTRVAIYPILPCLGCRQCQKQMFNQCSNVREIGSSLDGGFSEYIAIPKEMVQIGGLTPISDKMGDEEASLIEPLACCINSMFHSTELPDTSSTVAIIGDGPMGALHTQISKRLFGAATVVVGRTEHRLNFANSLGATTFRFEDSISNILEPTHGNGYDFVVVATNDTNALSFATKLAGRGAHVNIFAGFAGIAPLDSNIIHYNQLKVTGSFSSNPRNFKTAVELVSDGSIDLRRMVTHKFALDNIHDAISASEKYLGMRVAVSMSS